MRHLRMELVAAGRRATRRPLATAFAVLSLAIGLAALLLVAAALRTAHYRTLPGVTQAERLVEIGRADTPGDFDTLSYPDLVDMQTRVRALDAAWGHRLAQVYLAGDQGPVSVQAQFASGSYLPALGVRPALGRLLSPADEAPGAEHAVAVLSDGAHRRLFGGDPGIVGRTVRINGVAVRIVGVTEPGFLGHVAFVAIEVHLPLALGAALHLSGAELENRERRRSVWLHVGGRLAPGATLATARAELNALARHVATELPESQRERDLVAEPYGPLPAPARPVLAAVSGVLGALGLLLLAQASGNVAAMLFAQTEARSQELAVRSALGATPARLAFGALLDATLIVLAAGTGALLITFLGRDALGALGLPLPAGVDLALHVDGPVVLVAGSAALMLSLAAGLVPAWRLARRPPGAGLIGSQVIGGGRGRQRLCLVAIQTAVTLLMLAVAATMLASLRAAAGIDSGFRSDGIHVANTDMEPLALGADAAGARFDELTRRLEATPGIQHASYATLVPLSMSRMGFGDLRLAADPDRRFDADMNSVGPGFFATFGIQVRGRAIGTQDTLATDRVAVINETLARSIAPGGDALGRVFELGEGERWAPVTVVGIVPDGRYRDLADAGRPFAFLAARQWERERFSLMVASDLPAAELQRVVTETTRSVLPDLPPPHLQPFASYAALSLLPQRLVGSFAAILGGVALLLAGLGLYAALAHQVERRTREFGVRMALGADARAIARTAVGSALPWLGGGLVVGLLAALAARQVLQGLILGDAGLGLTGPVAALLLVMVTIALAIRVPLRRALAVKPMEALRQD
jgi:putative ABC transport system permease protein